MVKIEISQPQNIFAIDLMKVDKLFEGFAPLLKAQGAELVKKVGFVYHFEILKAKGYPINLMSETPTQLSGPWTSRTPLATSSRAKREQPTPRSL